MKMRKKIWGILLSVTMLSSFGLSGTYAEEDMLSDAADPFEEAESIDEYTEPEVVWEEADTGNYEMETEIIPDESENPAPTLERMESEIVSEAEYQENSGYDTVPDGFSEENGLAVFSEENADLLYAENDPEGENLIEEIQEGEMIALAAIPLEAELSVSSSSDPGLARAAAASAQYRMVVGDTLTPDEVTKQMQYREIVYTDGNGKKRTSPIYCLNASKEGIDTQNLKAEAIKTLKNSTVQKLLYFGYGGPGDIADSYDPTCDHIRWSRWQNRYVFTHMALSKVYSNEYGRSSEEECEHAGVNRYLAKIKSLKIPARDGVVFQAKDKTGNLTSKKNQSVLFSFIKNGTQDHTWDWADRSEKGFTDGFMVSDAIRMIDTGKANNTITISRPANAAWQLGYWVSESDYTSRGDKNPRILKKGASLTVKSGYVFRILMPLSFTKKETWTFPMSLNPVTFLFVDGSIQTGEDVQDFGTYVYQGTAASASLVLNPDIPGKLVLTKKDVKTEKEVAGASYGIYASADIQSGNILQFKKNELIAEGVTDEQGKIAFANLPAGSYYIKELSAPVNYLSDTTSHSVKIKSGDNSVTVTDIPDLRGRVSVQKADQETGADLEGAVFTVYMWDSSLKAYTGGSLLNYDKTTQRYVSEVLQYSPENQGKFQIKEIVNPSGYMGSFTAEFTLENLNPGEERLFEYRVENVKITYPHIEVRKIDAESGKNLAGAEFTLYEWEENSQKYQTKGILLDYDSKNEKYVSGDLKVTDSNQGKFKIVETKNPEGYEGIWEQELVLNGKENVITYTVPNNKIQPPKGKIQIAKRDALTGIELRGAEFRICPWSKKQNTFQKSAPAMTALTWLEDKKIYESAELELTADNQGRFLVEETRNPEGYGGSWSKEVTLTEDGQILTLTVDNTPLMGEITIVKKIRTEDITWAHGAPTFLFSVTGKDRYGLAHTYETSMTFLRDAFSDAGEGFGIMQVTLPDIPLGEYQIYEKPVLRYYLKDVLANTGNVSITRGGASGYGSDPKQVAYGTARLSPDARNASITFINEKSRYDGYSHNNSVKNTIPIKFE